MRPDLSSVPLIPVFKCMTATEDAIPPVELGSTKNTRPNKDGITIPRELFRDWTHDCPNDPFPTMEGVIEYAKRENVWDNLQRLIKTADWNRVISTEPWCINSEVILETMLKTHFDIVNLALERTVVNGRHVMIQGGKSANADDCGQPLQSEPDRASFLAPTVRAEDGTLLLYSLTELDCERSSRRRNEIPGEIKIYFKFRREYLDALTTRYDKPTRKMVTVPNKDARKEAEKVFTQIYQYMNERGSVVGYVMTDQELVCVRRVRETRHGVQYGVMDIAPSIPLSTEEGNLNAKLILWYLHHKFAVTQPHKNRLPTTPKPAEWAEIATGVAQALRTPQEVGLGIGPATRANVRAAKTGLGILE